MKSAWNFRHAVAIFAALAISVSAFSQVSGINVTAKKTALSENALKRWSHLDPEKDSVPGMSVDRAYAELVKGKRNMVVVAVIDSGVDAEHEDLAGNIWANPDEIADNGIDDDKNGYIDDRHGWNFIGDVTFETLEVVRLLKKSDPNTDAYKRLKSDYDTMLLAARSNRQKFEDATKAHEAIKKALSKSNYSHSDLKGFNSPDTLIARMKPILLGYLERVNATEFNLFLETQREKTAMVVERNLNLEYDARRLYNNDANPENLEAGGYGNNRVYAKDKKDSDHGTHVAGIIAQNRNNAKGGDGVADKVAIMSLRAIPYGDEYDKDVALAIRYAVDNGAKIINGSFGKLHSAHKEWVWDAIRYASKKNVLIVLSAMNEGSDIDLAQNAVYPTDFDVSLNEIADNVIVVGALQPIFGRNMIAQYSNFGSRNVDIFAPGSRIFASLPNDGYGFKQGTSMAAPNVSGIAALLLSMYPKLSASELKKIIMESGVAISMDAVLGNGQENRSFAKACRSGKIANAYNALLMAGKTAKN